MRRFFLLTFLATTVGATADDAVDSAPAFPERIGRRSEPFVRHVSVPGGGERVAIVLRHDTFLEHESSGREVEPDVVVREGAQGGRHHQGNEAEHGDRGKNAGGKTRQSGNPSEGGSPW